MADEDPNNSPSEYQTCQVCDKSIRGDTLNKIHVTTAQHVKKVEALVAAGRAQRTPPLPVWTDFTQYLDYLQLDEPIIGLHHLMELGDSEILRYRCRLCFLDTDMPSMASHVVGRKHRQKYLELSRSDLVTWDSNSAIAQQGKIVRAKAEVVERQEGRGFPQALKKKTKSEKSKNVNQKVNPRAPQSQTKTRVETKVGPRINVQSYLKSVRKEVDDVGYLDKRPMELGYPEEALYRPSRAEDRRYPAGHGYPEEASYSLAEVEGGAYGHGYMEDDLHRRPYPEDDIRGRSYREDEICGTSNPEVDRRGRSYPENDRRGRSYPENDRRGRSHPEDDHRGRSYPEQDDRGRSYMEDDNCGGSYPEDDIHGRSYPEDDSGRSYPEEDGRRRSYLEDDVRGRSYLEDDVRGRSYPEDDIRGRSYQEDDVRGRSYQEGDTYRTYPGKNEHGTAFLQGDAREWAYPKEDLSKRRYHEENPRSRSPAAGRSSRGQNPKGADLYSPFDEEEDPREKYTSYEGSEPGRGEMVSYGRHPGVDRGGRTRSVARTDWVTSEEQVPAKKKRKSRFSDATEAEKELYSIRTETHIRQFEELVVKKMKQTPPATSSLPALPQNNIQIENVDEANFLKDKLCSLLKEFQAKKVEQRGSSSLDPHMISKDYNHMSGMERLGNRYDDDPREMPEARRSNSMERPRDMHDMDPRKMPETRRRNMMEPPQDMYDNPRKMPEARRSTSMERPRDVCDVDPRQMPEARRSAGMEHPLDVYDVDPRQMQEARRSAGMEQPRDVYDVDPREMPEAIRGNNMEWTQDSYDIDPRQMPEARIYDGNTRGSQQHSSVENVLEMWNAYGGVSRRPPERVEDHPQTINHPDDEGRGYYREAFGKAAPLTQSPALCEDSRMFSEGSQGTLYRHDYHPDVDLRDPRQPSSSAPWEGDDQKEFPSNLDKIASTLLQLVARNN